MSSSRKLLGLTKSLALLMLALAALGCGEKQDPVLDANAARATELLNQIRTDNYRGWQRAPGFETRKATSAPHGDEVDIFLNPTLATEKTQNPTATSWPVGSIVAKDGYSGGAIDVVAIMQKTGPSTWFFVEVDKDDKVMFAGDNLPACADCHSGGVDFVVGF